MKRSHLIIGAGFIGTHLTKALLRSGEPVTLLTRSVLAPTVRAELEAVRLVVGDASVRPALGPLIQDCSHVYYCAGGLMPAEANLDPAADAALALPPVISVLEECRIRPTAHLTFISSGGTVYGRPRSLPVREDHVTQPDSSYGIMKLTAEKYIGMYSRLYGVRATILRCANVYGPGQPGERSQGVVAAFLLRLTHGKQINFIGDGSVVRDFVYIGDVVACIIAGTFLPDELAVINVGAGTGTSIAALLTALEKATGLSARVRWLPARDFDIPQIVLDVSQMRDRLMVEPISLESGLRLTIGGDGE